jgi:hypothetical protein
MTRRLWLGVATLAALAAGGCGDSGTGGVAGDLVVSYFQAGAEPGAMLLTITGGPVSKVTALGGQQVSFASPFSGTTKVVLLGTFGTGDLLHLTVPDVNQATSYSVRVDQVADKTTFALIDPAGYTFTVHK